MAKINPSLKNECCRRDHNRCRICGFHDPDIMQADHRIPRSAGGKDSLDNLQCLCPTCNNIKSNSLFCPEYPILPAIQGFGDWDTIKQKRAEFKRLLLDREIESLVEQVKAKIENGCKSWVVANYLQKQTTKKIAKIVMSKV